MTRRDLLKMGAAAVALVGLPSAALAQQTRDPETLAQLSAYLNSVTTMQGRFTQQSSDGRVAQGAFYLRRPGRLRFEYDEPYPTLVVADGVWAAVINRRAKTLDRLPLNSTPLALLLRENVNLTSEGAVRDVQRGPGILRVTAVDPQRPGDGSVTMIFSTNPIELQQWIVVDPQGKTSTISMNNVQRGMAIEPAKFVIEDPNFR
ncbi:outer membrane lipoprotein carrier protein LolA [Neomegalonema sp.]|uniref:LolA family protein n=1 Tax=Neomegalonema sp. TaxID=2039713 RepID=UPI0026249FA2|nr:outer-membrane lipoprotein carrier protein LolA [Neomegalonema sp.]MDD2868993.1 outer-membrane lipoprotein carrier protein LolA [Neomegalonema sp.]